ncbi:FtsX-like permease family protein [Paractinoplanes atraurantiacus]|uniref:Putative ABC transport system permease protein n=1 Tax=Paractinoplanes atraurantiacus TaxID=1036182 RepID=A0A285KLC7_9ACTN|nr:FtsX-like permease family protein [Actinoplanes atraurantiacus]SNY73452.1 putative ABC transport system permease protein [Actinoplanes atraurantiacus]
MIRQALRRNPWSFLGPFSTQMLAAALVTAGLGIGTAVEDAGIVFLMVAIYLSIIIVGVTMSATIAQQARDIALVRAIGATPGRVRRAVAAQAAIVAVPATLLGVPLGGVGGRAWIDGVVAHGLAPAGVTFHPHPGTLPIALAVTVGTSLAGALIAAIRPSRVRPSMALAESSAPRRRIGPARTTTGLVLVLSGVVLSVAIADLDAETTDALGLFVMLALCVGAGLLGPALLKVAALAGRLFGDTGRMAGDIIGVRAKALSGALVPLTLAIAFTAVKVIVLQTTEHETGTAPPAADRWLEYTGTAVYVAFAAVAAVNTLVTVVLARRRDLAVTRLAGATRGRALRVVICEALLVTGTALVVGAAVAATTTVPLLHTALGTWTPWMPATWLLTGVLATAALVLAGTALPAALAMRRPPIEVVS